MHRAGKYLVDKAVSLPAPHGPVDPRVVDFREIFGIPFDGQHLPFGRDPGAIQHLRSVQIIRRTEYLLELGRVPGGAT